MVATTILRILQASPAALGRYYPSYYPAMTCESNNHAYSVMQYAYYHSPIILLR